MKWIVTIALATPAAVYAFGSSPLNTFWDDAIGVYVLFFITFLIGLAFRRWWYGPDATSSKPHKDWLAGFKERKKARELTERRDRTSD